MENIEFEEKRNIDAEEFLKRKSKRHGGKWKSLMSDFDSSTDNNMMLKFKCKSDMQKAYSSLMTARKRKDITNNIKVVCDSIEFEILLYKERL